MWTTAYDTTAVYDPDNNPTATLNPLERSGPYPTITGYDTFDNPTLVETPAYNPTLATKYSGSNPPPLYDPTETVYDSANRPTRVLTVRSSTQSDMADAPACATGVTAGTAPTLAVAGFGGDYYCTTTTAYDGAGQTIATTDGNAQTTFDTYDGVGNKVMVNAPGNGSNGVAPLTTETAYDADGNAVAVCPPQDQPGAGPASVPACGPPGPSNPYGSATTYDDADRPASVQTYRAAETSPQSAYAGGVNLVTTDGYDAAGNLTSTTDPNGTTTTWTYDALERKITQTATRNSGQSEVTTWNYDPAGNVTSVIDPSTETAGDGTGGSLVIDGGSTGGVSSVGGTYTQSNPYPIPAGAHYSSVVLQNGGWVTGTGPGLNLVTANLTVCSTCGVTEAGSGDPGGGQSGLNGATGTGATAGGGGQIYGTAAASGGGGGGHDGAGTAAASGGGGGGHDGAGTSAATASGSGQTTPGGTAGGGGGQPDFTDAGDDPPSASGGGGGGGGEVSGGIAGSGGAGGGYIHITASGSITVNGTITASGTAGSNATSSNTAPAGGGGGGAGGGIWLAAPTVNLSAPGDLNASGGGGGAGADGGSAGGAGAPGYIRLDADNTPALVDTAPATGPNYAVDDNEPAATPLDANVPASGAAGGVDLNFFSQVTAYAYDPDERQTTTLTGAQTLQANPSQPGGTATAAPGMGGGINERTTIGYDASGDRTLAIPPTAYAATGSLTAPDLSYAVRTDYNLDGEPTVVYQPRWDANTADVTPSGGDPGGDAQTAECPTTGIDPQLTLLYGAAYPAGVGVCETTTGYDADDRPVSVTQPDSTPAAPDVDTATYTLDGLVATISSPNPSSLSSGAVTTSYLYDGDGRQTQVTAPPANTTSTGSSSSDVTTSSYWPDGQVSQTAGEGYCTVTTSSGSGCPAANQVTHIENQTWTGDGQQATTVSADANGTSGLPAADYTTTYTWTTDGLEASVASPASTPGTFETTSYVYDNDGNPLRVYDSDANATSKPYNGSDYTAMSYTADNLLATETQPVAIGSGGVTNSRTTTYTYAPGGQKTSQDITQTKNGTTTDAGPLAYTYLPDGLPATQTGRNAGADITTTYDQAGQPTSILQATLGAGPAAAPTTTTAVTASYYLDELPRTVTTATGTGTATTPNATQSFAYNGADNPTVTEDSPDVGNAAGTNAFTYTNYNSAGLASAETSTLDSGNTTTWVYDTNGQPATQTETDNGQPAQTQTWGYYPDQTLQGDTITTAAGNVDSYGYTYDDDGNKLTQADQGANSGGTETYSYGPGDQITGYSDTNGVYTVAYDADDNRTQVDNTSTGVATNWTYNLDNSTASVQVAPSSGTAPAPTFYTYYPQGDVEVDGCSTYTYDSFDRTASVQTGGNAGFDCPSAATTSSYTYDGLNRQTSETNSSTNLTTTYRYDGLDPSNRADEINAASTAGMDNQYQPGPSDSPMAVSATAGPGATPNVTYLDGDGQGNITDLIAAKTPSTATGTLTCAARFDPWGDPEKPGKQGTCNTTPTATPVTNDYWYQTERKDTTTGNYQFGARTYTPNNADFTQPDTYGPDQTGEDLSVGTDPLTENTYAYVNGNPLNFDDPNGHAPLGISCTTAANCAAVRNEQGNIDNIAFAQTLVPGVQREATALTASCELSPQSCGDGYNATFDTHPQTAFNEGIQVNAIRDAGLALIGERGCTVDCAGQLSGPQAADDNTLGGCYLAAASYLNALYNGGQGATFLNDNGDSDCVKPASGIKVVPEEPTPLLDFLGSLLPGASCILAFQHATVGNVTGCGLSALTIVAPGADAGDAAIDASEGAAGAETAGDAGDLADAGCGGQSFTPTTQVRLADGVNIPIDQVRAGDKVIATNPTTGNTQPETVEALWVHHDTDLLDLTIHTSSGEAVIHTTQRHLVYDLTAHRWVQAEHLRPGNRLYTSGGALATVVGSKTILGGAEMWGLTVADDHDFYIATSLAYVLVHNCNGILLGKSLGLAERALAIGGRTLMNEDDYLAALTGAINNGEQISVALDGVPGSSLYSKVISAAQFGLSGSQYASPFDREIALLYSNDALGSVTFYEGGEVLENPFS